MKSLYTLLLVLLLLITFGTEEEQQEFEVNIDNKPFVKQDSRILTEKIKKLDRKIDERDAEFNLKQEEMQRYENMKNDKIRSLESRIKLVRSKIESTKKEISSTKRSIDNSKKEIRLMEREYKLKQSSLNLGAVIAHFLDEYVIPFIQYAANTIRFSVTKAYYFLRSLYDQVYLAILSLYMKLLEYDSFVELQMWVNRVWVKFTSLLQYCWNEFFAPQIHFLSKHLSPLKKDSRALWKAIKTRDMQKIERIWNNGMQLSPYSSDLAIITLSFVVYCVVIVLPSYILFG
ncbi:hypothetical protein WA171_005117 [Blastocystis sp. BT1]